MQVLVRQEYRADRKERLGELVLRVADSFESAGVDQRIRASFSNSPLAEGVSAVAEAGHSLCGDARPAALSWTSCSMSER